MHTVLNNTKTEARLTVPTEPILTVSGKPAANDVRDDCRVVGQLSIGGHGDGLRRVPMAMRVPKRNGSWQDRSSYGERSCRRRGQRG